MSTNGLIESSLSEVCSLVTDGTHDTPTRVENGYPLIKAKEIVGGRIDFETCDQISKEEHLEVIARSKPEQGDTLFAHIGASLGEAAYVNTSREFSIKNIALFKPNPAVIDGRYLYYLVISPEFQALAKGTKTGSAQPFLSLGQLRSHRIRFHRDFEIQRRIADILSAYDDLIENNQRRIKILEAMARSLYREWFVNFRFPGHEKVPLVDSPLVLGVFGVGGKTIADLCESVSYGFTESASREEVGPKFLRITDIVPEIIDWDNVPYCEMSDNNMTKYLLLPGDIVVARTGATTGYAKRINKRHPTAVFASYLVRVRTKPGVSNRMLGLLMESVDYKQFIKANIGGAAQPQANAVVLSSMPLVRPPPTVAQKFDDMVEPFLDEMEVLAEKSRNLRRTRDLLLPRLLSGRVQLD